MKSIFDSLSYACMQTCSKFSVYSLDLWYLGFVKLVIHLQCTGRHEEGKKTVWIVMSPVLNTNARSDSVFCCKAPTIELAQFTDCWFTAECLDKIYSLSLLLLSFLSFKYKNYNNTFFQHKNCEKILPNMLNIVGYMK